MRSPRCPHCKHGMRPVRGKVKVDSVNITCSYLTCRCGVIMMSKRQEQSVDRKIRRMKHLHHSVTHYHHHQEVPSTT